MVFTRLREKSVSCGYETLRDKLIRDKMVLGITDEGIRGCLLWEKELTLTSAVEMHFSLSVAP